jgi:hypothetical protein
VLTPPLAGLPRPGQPGSHGALIDPKSRDDGLARTAVMRQAQDKHHHVRGRPQPVEGRGFGRREGLPTRGAAIALHRSARHVNVPSLTLSSGGVLGLGQNGVCEFIGGLLWMRVCSPEPITSGKMPEGPAFFKPSNTSPRFTGVVPTNFLKETIKKFCGETMETDVDMVETTEPLKPGRRRYIVSLQ